MFFIINLQSGRPGILTVVRVPPPVDDQSWFRFPPEPSERGGGTVSCQKGPGLLETQCGLSEETDQHTEAIERQAAAHLPTCAAMLADTLMTAEPKMCSTGAQTVQDSSTI